MTNTIYTHSDEDDALPARVLSGSLRDKTEQLVMQLIKDAQHKEMHRKELIPAICYWVGIQPATANNYIDAMTSILGPLEEDDRKYIKEKGKRK